MNVQDRLNAITGEKTEQEVSTSSTDKIFRVDKDGGQYFYNEQRQLHSFNDQPSIILKKGSKFWHKNGVLHRDNDKPAAIYIDHLGRESEEWFQDGTSYNVFYCADCEMRVNGNINHRNWRT